MANIPRKCPDCGEMYWSGFLNPVHKCIKESPIKFDSYPTREPKPYKSYKKEKKKYNHKCSECEQVFISGDKHRVYCSESCRMKGKNNNKITAANQKWLDNKPKKKPKYSSSQLNSTIQWKRLYEDESWAKRFKSVRG